MKKKLKTLIIDHSDTQRGLIDFLVKRNPQLELISSCKNANLYSGNVPPDLLIVDIESPGFDGIDSLKTLPVSTKVILITANTEYALQAFDIGVTDYLIKPVRASRFKAALEKAILSWEYFTDQDAEVASLQFRSDHEVKKIALSEIRWIEALGDYVKVITQNERFLILTTMKSIEETLPRDKFLRIHRSYIVNLNKVENFSHTRVEIEGNELPMSRKRKTKLEERLLPVE